MTENWNGTTVKDMAKGDIASTSAHIKGAQKREGLLPLLGPMFGIKLSSL